MNGGKENMTNAEVLDKRDDILKRMDVQGAKEFLREHGGFVAPDRMDWVRILHLARLECVVIDHEFREESHIYLARTGAQRVSMLPSGSPYLKSAMDLLFPPLMFFREMDKIRGRTLVVVDE